jgi:hypothetical protein
LDNLDQNPLERLQVARKDLSRLLDELREFEERLNGIARDLRSLPPNRQEEGAPPQSVSRADAPVVESHESPSNRGD